MKYFSCQPDSHNAFVSLTNCTLTYFTVDCPRYQTYSAAFPTAATTGAAAAATAPSGSNADAAPRDADTSNKTSATPRNEADAWRCSSAWAGDYRSPNSTSAYSNVGASTPGAFPAGPSPVGPSQETKAHVQCVVQLPDCFHAQSSCFSMANRSLFGTEMAFVGTSHGLLALVTLADRSVVFAADKDPDTLRDVEKRQRYHQYTRAGGSGGYMSATASASAARGSGRRTHHSSSKGPHTREDDGNGAAAAAEEHHHRSHPHYGSDGEGLSDASTGPRGDRDGIRRVGSGSFSNSNAESGTEDFASNEVSSTGYDGPPHQQQQRGGWRRAASMGSTSYPSLSGYRSGSSSAGSASASAGRAGGGSGGGVGGASGHTHGKRRAAAATRLEVPTTITWMRDKPLILVGYSSGRVQWYQVRVSPAKQQQLADPSREEPYREAIPAGALIHHIHDPANSAHTRITSVTSGGTGDGIAVELVTGCVLRDSGALVSSDYFPANGYVVVGGERCMALFSAEQPEAPLCRLSNFGCSFLYCHPFLPLVGTLSWGWNTVGPCYYHHPASVAAGVPATAKTAADVFVGNPNGYEGGCLLNILSLEENTKDDDDEEEGDTARADAGGPPVPHSEGGRTMSSAGRLGADANDKDKDGGSGDTDDEGEEAEDGRTQEGGAHNRDSRRPRKQAGAARPHAPYRFRHVQQRLIESHAPRYGAYFSFSWKFSFDLELGVCNVEEGLVHVLRFRRRTSTVQLGSGRSGSEDERIDALANFPYQFVHEHRLRLPLHSLVNVEYVSAATSVLAASAVPGTNGHGGGGEGEGGAAVSGASRAKKAYYAHATAALQVFAGNGGTTVAGASGAAAAAVAAGGGGVAGRRGAPGGGVLTMANAAAPQRFAALFQAQEILAHSAMLMTLAADGATEKPRGGALSLRGYSSSSASLRGLGQQARDLYQGGYASSLGAAALAAGGSEGLGTRTALDAGECAPYVRPQGRASGGGGGGLALKENILAAELLQPMAGGGGGGGGGAGRHRRGTSRASESSSPGHRGAKSGRRRSRQSGATATMSVSSQALTGGHGGGGGSSASPATAVSGYGEEVHSLRSLLRVGPGSTSSIVGMNFAGEVASVPVEVEAIATWHEEGSVFVGLGATICAADIVTIQGIERQMKRRMECGFRLSAAENVRALTMVAQRSVRNTYSGLNNEASTTAMSDLSTIFTYVATLEKVGLIGPVGDVPSVCELLLLQAKGSEDALRADAILASARTKLPQAVLDLQRQHQQQQQAHQQEHREEQPHPQQQTTSARPKRFGMSGDALRETARLLLLHILNWLPPNMDLSTGRIIYESGSSSHSDAFALSESTSTEHDVERAVAVQVLHSRFAAGAAILRRFGYRNPSYQAMANLITAHEGTLSAIRESDAHVRETFLGSLSPWLLAVFLYLCADSEDTLNYRSRIYGNPFLPLWDRVAIALILESDTDRLLHTISETLLRDCTLIQSLMLVHGVSASTYPMMQEIVDGTGDFQLAACLYARIGVMSPQFLALFPSAAAAPSVTGSGNKNNRNTGSGSGGGTDAAPPRHSTTVGELTAMGSDGHNPSAEGEEESLEPHLPTTALLHVVPSPAPPAAAMSGANRSSTTTTRGARHHGGSDPLAAKPTAAASLLDPARLARSQLPPPPPPPPAAVPSKARPQAAFTSPLNASSEMAAAAGTKAAPSFIAAWADAGAASVLPPFFHKYQRDLSLSLCANANHDDGVPATAPWAEKDGAFPWRSGGGGEEEAEREAEECPWVWWVAGYRAFLDSEQAFVERTMFDVACQRLREDGEAIVARAAAVMASAWAAVQARGAGESGMGGGEPSSISASAGASSTSFLHGRFPSPWSSQAPSASSNNTSMMNASVGGGPAGAGRSVSAAPPGQYVAVVPGPSLSTPNTGTPMPVSQDTLTSLLASLSVASPGAAAAAVQRRLYPPGDHRVASPAATPYSPIARKDGMPEAALVAKTATAGSHLGLSPSSWTSAPIITPEQYRIILGALSNRTPRCSVCLHPVKVHQRESAQSLAWCTACLHGGHADHLKQWFSQHRVCPVDGCACHCDEDVSLC